MGNVQTKRADRSADYLAWYEAVFTDSQIRVVYSMTTDYPLFAVVKFTTYVTLLL